MARYFLNVPELQKAKMSDLEEVVKNEIKKTCIEIVQDSIKKNVYNASITTEAGNTASFPNKQLHRAVDFRITARTASYIEFEIFINTAKINSYMGDHGLVNHTGNWGSMAGADVGQVLPHWIEEGTSGLNPVINYEGQGYMEGAKKKLETGSASIRNQLVQAFAKRGWSVL